MSRSLKSPARGMGAVFMLAVLVVAAVLAASAARMATTGASAAALNIDIARARAAADTGLEWGRWMLRQGSWGGCIGLSQTLDLRADTTHYATVRCNCSTYSEGTDASNSAAYVRVCSLQSVACNRSSCPDDVAARTSRDYVEWSRGLEVIGP